MSISKIGSLFAANVDAVPATSPSSPVAPQANTPQVPSTDAVVLATNLQNTNRTPLSEADSGRASKVQDLKAKVRSGSYKPDSEKVAVAVIRDLA